MTKFRLMTLAGAMLGGAIIGLASPAGADATSASDIQHTINPLDSMGYTAVLDSVEPLDAMWPGPGAH